MKIFFIVVKLCGLRKVNVAQRIEAVFVAEK